MFSEPEKYSPRSWTRGAVRFDVMQIPDRSHLYHEYRLTFHNSHKPIVKVAMDDLGIKVHKDQSGFAIWLVNIIGDHNLVGLMLLVGEHVHSVEELIAFDVEPNLYRLYPSDK